MEDRFTCSGLWIRQPTWSEWVEVSVTGAVYSSADCSTNSSESTTATAVTHPPFFEPAHHSTTASINSNPISNAINSMAASASKRRTLRQYPFTNELLDGTLINIGGIIIIFQSPISMARNLEQVIRLFLHLVQCFKVLIRFLYLINRQKILTK